MAAETFYFYVLLCNDGTFYAGYTTDPKRRKEEHNAGTGAKYTRVPSRRPVTMIHLESFATKSEAMSAEYRFKQLSRKQKEAYLKKQGSKHSPLSAFHNSHCT